MAQEKGFYWKRLPRVEIFFVRLIDDLKAKNPAIAQFQEKLATHSSTRLIDWLDHLVIPPSFQTRETLEDLGFLREAHTSCESYNHPGVRLPRVVMAGTGSAAIPGIALRVEDVADFLQVNGFTAEIEGKPLSTFRRCQVSTEKDVCFYVVERRGSEDFEPAAATDRDLHLYAEAVDTWRTIPRCHDDEEKGYSEIVNLAGKIAAKLGKNRAAHVVCAGERNYWLSRNQAGRVQAMRQQTLGLGWANHDHHTFRSTRHHFAQLVELFARLGFEKRERFYAGAEAGWGAQVMENTAARLVLFLDVDLAPDEVGVDFAATPLEERDSLGTVGLWCALHGDSMLKAGMHHLAANFGFRALTKDLLPFGVEFMAPFSNFSYLQQAFSTGEKWPVDPERVQTLLDSKRITPEAAEKFLVSGAIGSHLENIQRREGYKGFNQKNVSNIIRNTDPRGFRSR
jgi:hypothetical protein